MVLLFNKRNFVREMEKYGNMHMAATWWNFKIMSVGEMGSGVSVIGVLWCCGLVLFIQGQICNYTGFGWENN